MARSLDLFRKRAKARLEALRMSQADLARRMKQSPTAVNRWLSGETAPGLEAIDEISSALSTTTAELIAPEEPSAPEKVPLTWDEAWSLVSEKFADLEHVWEMVGEHEEKLEKIDKWIYAQEVSQGTKSYDPED